jgi:hypothetical protein
MTDLIEMVENHQKQEQEWQPLDNPWLDHDPRIVSDIEKLNLMAKMHEGDD